MTKVTLENCNEIIAKFMGKAVWKKRGIIVSGLKLGRPIGLGSHELYTKSLDSLVPVWEKLGVYEQHYYVGSPQGNRFIICYGDKLTPTGATYKSDMVKAAALATAKAIKELENGE